MNTDCGCTSKNYNISLGCCVPVLAPIENYYTKYQIDQMLSGETSGCCITPEEVDEKISSAITDVESEIPSLDGYATEEYVTQSISGKADSDDLATVSGDLQTLSSEVQSMIESAKTEIEAEIPSLDGYATEEYVDQSVSGKADALDLATVSGDLQTLSAEVQTIIISGVSGISSAECQSMINESVSGKLDTSVFQSFSGSVDTELGNKQDASGMTAYTQNDSFTAHTADTTVHVTSNEKQVWNNKANIWSGTQADWALISGGTLDNNTIYLVY